MLQWVSRLSRPFAREGPRRSSVLAPDEVARNQVRVTARDPDGPLGELTVVLTRKRLLFTNETYTEETRSIPLGSVTVLESTPAGIRIAYHDGEGAERELWLDHIPHSEKDDPVWMGDDPWVQSVADGIMQETGRDVWKEGAAPWYVRGS